MTEQCTTPGGEAITSRLCKHVPRLSASPSTLSGGGEGAALATAVLTYSRDIYH